MRQSRILALDLGKRRIGLAVSDLLGVTAQGLATWERVNRESDLAEMKRLVKEHQVSMILVGQPLHMDGRKGAGAEDAERFAANLHRHLGVEVRMWDERLTTAEAQRVLKSSGVSVAKRREAVDRMAAVILLQSYLDTEPQ